MDNEGRSPARHACSLQRRGCSPRCDGSPILSSGGGLSEVAAGKRLATCCARSAQNRRTSAAGPSQPSARARAYERGFTCPWNARAGSRMMPTSTRTECESASRAHGARPRPRAGPRRAWAHSARAGARTGRRLRLCAPARPPRTGCRSFRTSIGSCFSRTGADISELSKLHASLLRDEWCVSLRNVVRRGSGELASRLRAAWQLFRVDTCGRAFESDLSLSALALPRATAPVPIASAGLRRSVAQATAVAARTHPGRQTARAVRPTVQAARAEPQSRVGLAREAPALCWFVAPLPKPSPQTCRNRPPQASPFV